MKNKVLIALLSIGLVSGSITYAADTKEQEKIEASQEENEMEEEEAEEEADQEEEAEEDEADQEEETEETEEEEPLRLVSVDELEKYIDLAEYIGVACENEEVVVTDMMISEQIDEARKNSAELVSDEKATVESGDIADIAYVGRKDGEAFDGGTSDSYLLEIGSGTFIPGFEDGVIGMKVGEVKEIPLKFPDEYPAENLAGADVVFEVTVNGIQRVPELTDEWVAKNTEQKTVEEYREAVLEDIRESMEKDRDDNLKYSLFETVYDNSVVKEYPEEDLAERVKVFTDYIEEMVALQGMELDEYLEQQGTTQEVLDEQANEYGEYSLKLAMVIQSIMDAEGLDFSGAEADMMKVQIAQTIGATSFEQIIEFYGEFEAYIMLGQEMTADIILKNAEFPEVVTEEDEPADEDLSDGEEIDVEEESEEE